MALVVLTAARMEEPEERRRLVEIVGDSLILHSFFALATGYPAEDLLAISDMLGNDDSGSTEDLVGALRSDYVALAREAIDAPAELVRRRAHRRNVQARKREQEVEDGQADIERRVKDARAEGRREGGSDVARVSRQRDIWRRVFALFVTLLALGGLVATTFVLDVHRSVPWIGVVLLVVLTLEGVAWVLDAMSTRAFVASIVVGLAWTVVGSLMDSVVGDSVTDDDAPPPTPSPTSSATPGQ
jgi:hypothetical protein